jgi:predicted dehydrogenase
MNIAIVGCGYVADFYLATLPRHPELRVRGVFDRLPERALTLSQRYGVPRYESLDALLGDQGSALVLNLTNPRDHFEVSEACLRAGKHVYSEKPMAMEVVDAKALVALAAQLGLRIVSAPCSQLGETAQALRQALHEEVVGQVRVVYAEMDDGLVTRMQYRRWQSDSGMPWPYKDEFEVGCTLEHAGYYLSCLIDWFGPVDSVTAFASVQVPDKVPGESLNLDSPDFSVACVTFVSGVVARLTCSILAPHDHSLRIVGDRGVLYTKECWDYRSPVFVRHLVSIRRKTFLSPLRRSRRLPSPPQGATGQRRAPKMDYARGPAELARAIGAGLAGRLTMDFSLHVNELALAIHHARRDGATYRMTTSFNRSECDN